MHQRSFNAVSKGLEEILSIMGSLEAFGKGCISQDGLSSEQPLNPSGLRPRWTCHIPLNPDDGRLQAGFAMYVSYIHGAATGYTAHCPHTALTPGLRLMVLLLSGHTGHCARRKRKALEGLSSQQWRAPPRSDPASSNNASNKYAFTLLLRSRGWKCFRRGAHDQVVGKSQPDSRMTVFMWGVEWDGFKG